jgi:hypothetical protein
MKGPCQLDEAVGHRLLAVLEGGGITRICSS